jgi:hypothetical protein
VLFQLQKSNQHLPEELLSSGDVIRSMYHTFLSYGIFCHL